METGLVVNVPDFIEAGQKLVINTTEGTTFLVHKRHLRVSNREKELLWQLDNFSDIVVAPRCIRKNYCDCDLKGVGIYSGETKVFPDGLSKRSLLDVASTFIQRRRWSKFQ